MDKDQVSELIHEYAIDRGGQYGVLVPEENFGGLAEAIAEGMKVGVVAEIKGRWSTDDLGYHVLTVATYTTRQEKKIRLATVMQGGLDDDIFGELVRVTVTKLEGEDG